MRKLGLFTDYLKNERRYSPHTVTAYIHDVEQFFVFIAATYDIQAEEDVKPMHVKAWLYDQRMQEGMSPRSINRKLSSLNAYYRYLLRQGEVKINPLASVQGLKTEKRNPQWVAQQDTEMLLEDVDFGDGFPAIRNRLIMELFYGTGIRLAELIGLQEGDVSLGDNTLKVLGKRNKERIVPIPRQLKETLQQYLKQKQQEGFLLQNLVVTDKGTPVYPMFVYRVVKQYISLVSTIQKNSPHVLRHTYATHLLNNGADINAIKELLGHASLAATQVYTHNSIERLKNIYKQAHPKG